MTKSIKTRLFFFWFGAFFKSPKSKGDENKEGYYELLGVDKSATQDEIRKAYKVKSRQLHPDKVAQREGRASTEADKVAFQKMKESYDVLHNPSQREMYDEFGETGLQLMNGNASAPMELVENFMNSSFCDRFKIYFLFLLIIGLSMIGPIVICLRVDDLIETPYATVFIPIWIYNLFSCFVMFLSILSIRSLISYLIQRKESNDADDDDEINLDDVDRLLKESRIQLKEKYVLFFQHLLFVAFEIMLVRKVDEIDDNDWVIVFAPLFCIIVLRISCAIPYAFGPVVFVETDLIEDIAIKLLRKVWMLHLDFQRYDIDFLNHHFSFLEGKYVYFSHKYCTYRDSLARSNQA